MILKELISTLPNGLHDAHVSQIELDYVHRRMKMHLDVLVGRPDAPTQPERERLRSGVLEFTGLVFCGIDMPDPKYHYAAPEPLWIDASDLPSSVATVPEDAFGARIFVQQWNSFINIAARDASLVWKD